MDIRWVEKEKAYFLYDYGRLAGITQLLVGIAVPAKSTEPAWTTMFRPTDGGLVALNHMPTKGSAKQVIEIAYRLNRTFKFWDKLPIVGRLICRLVKKCQEIG